MHEKKFRYIIHTWKLIDEDAKWQGKRKLIMYLLSHNDIWKCWDHI